MNPSDPNNPTDPNAQNSPLPDLGASSSPTPVPVEPSSQPSASPVWTSDVPSSQAVTPPAPASISAVDSTPSWAAPLSASPAEPVNPEGSINPPPPPPIPTFTTPASFSSEPPPDLSAVPSTPNFSTPLPSTPLGSDLGNTPAEPTEPTEAIPTDLSHLVGNSDSGDSNQQIAPQPETLVVNPPPVVPSEAQVVGSEGTGFPKWIMLVGGVVLLLVIGASAYFILGIGRSSETTPPVAEETTVPIPTILPTETPTPAVGSGSFGNLKESTTSGRIGTPSPTGSSVFDRLKTTPRPTP